MTIAEVHWVCTWTTRYFRRK